MLQEEWIIVRKGLARRREIVAAAQRTGRSRHETLGLLVDFWCWIDAESVDGSLVVPRNSGLAAAQSDQQLLDGLAQTIGGDADFWRAVVEVGWLRLTELGVEIPNYERWLGRKSRERILNNARQARWRRAKAEREAVPGGTPAATPPPAPAPRPDGGSGTHRKPRTKAAADPRFARAWQLYPRKENKLSAERAWDKAEVTDELAAKIHAAVERNVAENHQWMRGLRFVPHFSTWINQKRWEDESSAVGGGAARLAAPAGKYDGIGITLGGGPPPPPAGQASLFPE